MPDSRLTIALLAATTWALAIVPSASAATVDVSGQTWFDAVPGEANELVITTSADQAQVIFSDSVPLVAGEGCTGGGPSGDDVTCELRDEMNPIIELRDGDDMLDTTLVDVDAIATDFDKDGFIVRGGDGADRIETGNTNDKLRPGMGDDEALAGEGFDTFVVEKTLDGDDVYDGGDGEPARPGSGVPSDDLFYRSDDPVTVTLAGGQDDGRIGEQDDLRRIEYLIGSDGDDTLIGTDGDEVLVGSNGRDLIRGGGGDDSLDGSGDPDRVLGEGGNDTIEDEPFAIVSRTTSGRDFIDGGTGNDFINGGPQDDHILGGEGKDELLGGSGSDVMKGGRGDDKLDGARTKLGFFHDREADRLFCGMGKDKARFELKHGDRHFGCERLEGVDRR